MTPAVPVSTGDRISSLDVLRGFALLGILVMKQMVLSTWWIRRFEYGLLEWLWRSLTYKRRMPMRRSALRPATP